MGCRREGERDEVGMEKKVKRVIESHRKEGKKRKRNERKRDEEKREKGKKGEILG